MSAYIVEKNHIVYLIAAAMSRMSGHNMTWYHNGNHHEIAPGDFERAADVGNMLWLENMASVSARYPNESSATLPGTVEAEEVIDAHLFSRGHWDRFDPVQVLKSCNCLDYQSCEHDGWQNSESKSFLDSLIARAIRALPGYEAAKWGAPEKSSVASISLLSLCAKRR